MEARDEPLLEEGPAEKFRGATLQIQHDSNQCSRSPSSQGDNDNKHWVIAQLPLSASGSTLANVDIRNTAATNSLGFLKPAVSGGADIVSPMTAVGSTQLSILGIESFSNYKYIFIITSKHDFSVLSSAAFSTSYSRSYISS